MNGRPADKFFAPIPARALSDGRLTARHLQVLGAVALHDRLGVNGQGCWAGRRRLAQDSGCNETHVSDALGDLRLYGYIVSTPHPRDNRTSVHRVVYTDDDAAIGMAAKAADRSRSRDPLKDNRSQKDARKVPLGNANALNARQNSAPNILGRCIYIGSEKNSAEAEHSREAEKPDLELFERQLNEIEAGLASPDVNLRTSAARCECQTLSAFVENQALPEPLRRRAAELRSIARDAA
jgi:hypothetical protein